VRTRERVDFPADFPPERRMIGSAAFSVSAALSISPGISSHGLGMVRIGKGVLVVNNFLDISHGPSNILFRVDTHTG